MNKQQNSPEPPFSPPMAVFFIVVAIGAVLFARFVLACIHQDDGKPEAIEQTDSLVIVEHTRVENDSDKVKGKRELDSIMNVLHKELLPKAIVPSSVPSRKTTSYYQKGYDYGYEDGYEDGLEGARDANYDSESGSYGNNSDYLEGYDDGYDDGYADGLEEADDE